MAIIRRINAPKIAIVVFLVALCFVGVRTFSASETTPQDNEGLNSVMGVPEPLSSSGLKTDFSKSSVDLAKVVSGGPGKDGIPALTNPKFDRMTDATVDDDTQVIIVENNGEVKFYPYSVLVWHEIVNDSVGGKPLAITFCPLCGSAVVFNRELNGSVAEFGVSGLLYESNMLMYSRSDSESLYSQSLGSAVIGSDVGERLERFPLELKSYAQAKLDYPTALVLSEDTGYERDYQSNPYADYDENDELFFSVSNVDNRFPAKELFYIVPIEGMSVAVQLSKPDGDYLVPDSNIKVSVSNGAITALWGEAEIPGYYEMWFSWATHHSDSGIVL